MMTSRRAGCRIAMLTPSSNTCLEPVTAAITAGLPGVSVHFSRFRVTEITLGEQGLSQFDPEPMLAAASLLADLKPGAILWNGTSGAWLGLDADRELCRLITERTGAPASTSSLAKLDAMAFLGAGSYGLAVPYTDDVRGRIVSSFEREGLRCVASAGLGISDNFAFDGVEPATIRSLVREVAVPPAQAVSIFCTNLRGAPLVDELEAELGLPVLDSVAVTIWKGLELAGCPQPVKGWGRLLSGRG